jgi:hypothetical protein
MSGGPISVPDWSNHELIVAGWARHDLDWEDAAAAHCAALARGSEDEALAHSGACLLRARESLAADDPRLATSLANHAAGLARRGDQGRGRPLARGQGRLAAQQVVDLSMSAPRVARSSLFHMRMEQRHRDTYEERWRLKWRDMAEKARRPASRRRPGRPRRSRRRRRNARPLATRVPRHAQRHPQADGRHPPPAARTLTGLLGRLFQ